MKRKILLLLISFSLICFIYGCSTNNNSNNTKKSTNTAKETTDSTPNLTGIMVDIYAGPGNDYVKRDTIDSSNILSIVREDHGWYEVECASHGRNYIKKDVISDVNDSEIPLVTSSIKQGPNTRPQIAQFNLKYKLTDDIDLLYSPKEGKKNQNIDAGNYVVIINIEPYDTDNFSEKMNIYYQIEFTTKFGKERAYVTERDLLDYDNPLRNFDEVKNNYATITYNGQNYYSATGAHIDGYLNNWKLENSIDISEDNWNIMGGITAVISGNTYTDESMGVYSGKLPMPTIQKGKKNYHKIFPEIDTTRRTPSTALAFTTFFVDTIPSFLSGAYSKVILNVELQSYEGEQKIVIRVDSPIELTQFEKHLGKIMKLSTLLSENSTPLELVEMDKTVDKRIRQIFPELTGDKLYSMDLSFASRENCKENGYGYYIIIDKELNVYAQPIFHNGTSFPVYYDGKIVFDAVHNFGMELLQLDEQTAKGFLKLLTENGFLIQGYTSSANLSSIWEEYIQSSDETSAYFLPADYDGDGAEEAFAITGISDDEIGYDNVKIYFINSKGNISCVRDKTYKGASLYGYLHENTTNNTQNYLLETTVSKFIIWEASAYGSGSTSIVLGVKDGMAYEPDISNCYMDFGLDEKNQFSGYSSDFSQGFHDYIEHIFVFNEKTRQFILQ